MGDGALLLILFAASHTAEDMLYTRAVSDLKHLTELIPNTALLCVEGDRTNVKSVPLESVRKGDILLVKAGEIVRPHIYLITNAIKCVCVLL